MDNLVKERKLVKVGPSEAENFSALNTYSGQRPLRERHVAFLAAAMKDGRFHTGSIALARCMYNGSNKVMVNGQHQCAAVIETGKKIDVVYQEFAVHSPTELSTLYRQFDCSIGSRTLKQQVCAEAVALGIPWIPKVLGVIHTGILLKEGLTERDSEVDRVAILGKYLDAGEFINTILSEDRKIHGEIRHMFRGAVAHAMILTYERDPGDSIVFWTWVRDGENLTKQMPAYALREYLKTVNVLNGRGAFGVRVSPPLEMTAKCIHAWNAYRRDEGTRLTFKGSIPKVAD